MKKISILFITILFTTSISYAQILPKEYIKELEYIDNNLSILIYNIIQNDYEDIASIDKDITFIESLLDSLNSSIDASYKAVKNKDLKSQDYILSVDNISNFYEQSILNIRLYFNNKDKYSFFNIINNYSNGNALLLQLKDKSSKAR